MPDLSSVPSYQQLLHRGIRVPMRPSRRQLLSPLVGFRWRDRCDHPMVHPEERKMIQIGQQNWEETPLSLRKAATITSVSST